MANQRRSKQLINVLDVHETKDMLTIATDFYKDLFKAESRPDIRIREDFFSDEEKVSQVENDLLSAPFTVDEIDPNGHRFYPFFCLFRLVSRQADTA